MPEYASTAAGPLGRLWWTCARRCNVCRPITVVVPAAGKPALHHKGFLADGVASFGSANWTRNSLALNERVAVVSMSLEAAYAERTIFEKYFEGSAVWDAVCICARACVWSVCASVAFGSRPAGRPLLEGVGLIP